MNPTDLNRSSLQQLPAQNLNASTLQKPPRALLNDNNLLTIKSSNGHRYSAVSRSHADVKPNLRDRKRTDLADRDSIPSDISENEWAEVVKYEHEKFEEEKIKKREAEEMKKKQIMESLRQQIK